MDLLDFIFSNIQNRFKKLFYLDFQPNNPSPRAIPRDRQIPKGHAQFKRTYQYSILKVLVT